MKSRWAKVGEQAALQELWRLCFGDDASVIASFFSAFPPQHHCRVIFEDQRLAAMANWLPVTLCLDGTRPGAYLYAVATHPAYRGQGLCRTLLAELEKTLRQEGFTFTALCPAETSLYEFYGRLGYETAFFCNHERIKPGTRMLPMAQIAPEDYLALRERYLPEPYCRWGEEAFHYLASGGVRFFRFPDGCAAVSPPSSGEIRILELLTKQPESAVTALCREMNAARAQVRQPGIKTSQGMLKWLIPGQKIPPADLGFAFD